MAKFNVGDKVYLRAEVEDTNRAIEGIYGLKTMDSGAIYAYEEELVHPETEYNKGYRDGWKLAVDIDKMPRETIGKIFRTFDLSLLDPNEVARRIEEWKKEQEEKKVKVGDILQYDQNYGERCLVAIKVYPDNSFDAIDNNGEIVRVRSSHAGLKKTGKTVDVSSFLAQITAKEEETDEQ